MYSFVLGLFHLTSCLRFIYIFTHKVDHPHCCVVVCDFNTVYLLHCELTSVSFSSLRQLQTATNILGYIFGEHNICTYFLEME